VFAACSYQSCLKRFLFAALACWLAFPVACAADEAVPAGTGAVPSREVLTGIDVLEKEDFKRLAGRRIGLITNQTGIDRRGVSDIQLLHEAAHVDLVAIFNPEHGLFGKLDQAMVDNSVDPDTGIEVYSLYGTTRKPTREMLAGIDTLVFDIQDIGTRFYTYISTMGNAMQAAAEHGIGFMVLDRPNPIGGVSVGGPVLDDGKQSFTGFHLLPVRHGMTTGELARLFRAELGLELELEVVPLEGWQRSDYFDDTGLPWVNPSPNMRSPTEALLYPGIGLLETTNLSVGRGTDTPFELIGAPWLDGERLAGEMRQLDLPGVEFSAVAFTPDASKFAGEACAGVGFRITDRARFDPLRTGIEIALLLRRDYPQQWDIDSYSKLLGNDAVLQAVRDERSYAEILAVYRPALEAFEQRRRAYLIYR